jgi:hypothetical protein
MFSALSDHRMRTTWPFRTCISIIFITCFSDDVVSGTFILQSGFFCRAGLRAMMLIVVQHNSLQFSPNSLKTFNSNSCRSSSLCEYISGRNLVIDTFASGGDKSSKPFSSFLFRLLDQNQFSLYLADLRA